MKIKFLLLVLMLVGMAGAAVTVTGHAVLDSFVSVNTKMVIPFHQSDTGSYTWNFGDGTGKSRATGVFLTPALNARRVK